MKINNIKVGTEYKNYKQLCEALGEKNKTGNSKQAQIKMWMNYFNFDKVGNTYIIKEVYDKPLVDDIRSTRNNFRHGLSHTNIYKVWSAMKNRCNNKKCSQFADYGGRGIKVCEEWQDKDVGFKNFYGWALDNGYEEYKRLSLDRKNVDGNYDPKNCRWTIQKIQIWNRRNTIYINKKSKLKVQKSFMRKKELVAYLNYLENIIIDLGQEEKIVRYKEDLRIKGLYTENVLNESTKGIFEKGETDEKK